VSPAEQRGQTQLFHRVGTPHVLTRNAGRGYRRRMPRTPRIDYPGAWHHVYSRGNRRERLFHAERDYQIYMATLAKVASSVRWRIHGYVLMPNHTHLVIETPTATLSRG